MKYLILDTNIYLDMIVSRNSTNSADKYELLKQLLDLDKVRIILPKIIEVEIQRNLTSEIENIGLKINNARNALQDTFWINHIEELDSFNSKIEPIKKSLGQLFNEFEGKKISFLKKSSDKIIDLFKNANVIEIAEDQELLSNVQRRRIYKRCPFHIEDKQSYADALIIETIINLRKYISLNDEDKVYFITGNYKDFSENKKEKEKIHHDIEEEIRLNNLQNIFNYRRFFNLTLIKDFEEESMEASIYEALKDEEEMDKYTRFEEIGDQERESVGLKPLSFDYEDYICQNEEVERFIKKINILLKNIEKTANDYTDLYYEIEEEFENINKEILAEKIEKYNENAIFCKIDKDVLNEDEFNKNSIMQFINHYFLDIVRVDEMIDSIDIKDYFDFGSIFTFKDLDGNRYELNVSGNLNPENYETDIIDINLYINSKKVAFGEIELYYGGIEFDWGACSDGSEESFECKTESLVEKIEELTFKLKKEIQKNIDKILILQEIFK